MPEKPLANSSIAQQTWQDKAKHICRRRRIGKVGIANAISKLGKAKRLFQSVPLGSDDVWGVIVGSGTEEGPSNPCHLIRKRYYDDIPMSSGR